MKLRDIYNKKPENLIQVKRYYPVLLLYYLRLVGLINNVDLNGRAGRITGVYRNGRVGVNVEWKMLLR
jgi:hypothetical protein